MLIVSLCILLAFVLWIRAKSKRNAHELPPAYPGALPFIGHTHLLFNNTSTDYLTDSNKFEVGDKHTIFIEYPFLELWLLLQDIAKDAMQQGGVTHVVLGTQIYYMIADADDALVAANACNHKHFAYNFVKPWLGDGLVTSSGELWQRNRKLIQSTFSLPVIHGFLNVFNNQSRKLVTSMESQIGKKPFDPLKQFQKIALETFCLATFGLTFVEDMNITHNYMTSAATILSLVVHRFTTFWLHSDFLFKLSGLKKKEQDAIQNLKIMSYEIIKRKKAAIKNAVSSNNTDDIKTTGLKFKPALDRLLELYADGTLNDKEVSDEIDTMVAAAFETLSHQMLYTLIFLGTAPNTQNKLFQEIQEVIGPVRDVDKDDINRLLYTNAVIMESVRLAPASPIMPRYVERDVKLKNYTMRAGSQCALFPLVYQNDPRWGTEREKFIPERWLDADLSGKKEFAGFGLGKRNCIGKQYAMVYMKVLLVYFIRQYIVTADASSLKFKIDFILKPSAGNVISLTKRK